MTDFENVRQALEELIAINNIRTKLPRSKELDESGNVIVKEHEVTARDLQEMNYQDLVSVCDLLGMSDIYMNQKQKEVKA